MNVKCIKKVNYEVITDEEICIEDVNMVSILDTERPGDYEYGYIRIDNTRFKEYYASDNFTICPFCGRYGLMGELDCTCETYSIVSEEEVLDDLIIASSEEHLKVVAYR